jgi:NAD(P)-dependent dehydrogenase (short-subunit alcohol dehydrogenase family)
MSAHKSIRTVAAVTGATGAIGNAIANQLASKGLQVILLTRDPKKSTLAIDVIKQTSGNDNISFELVDLASRDSIQALATRWQGPLHILINNAAISPPNRTETREGIELQFATNVLGYFWMSESLSPVLAESSSTRIINVASYWAGGLNLDDLEFKLRPYHNHDAYRQSKQANRMLTPVFANMLEPLGITVNACHPGDVNSTLSNSLGFGGSQSPDEGAKTPVWLSTSDSVQSITGKYFEDCQETSCAFGQQKSSSQQLYEICQTYT